MNIDIIYEDNYVLVIDKPAGLPVQPDKSGDESVLSLLSENNPDLRLTHRLDRAVSGVMVIAKTAQVSAELSRQIQDGIFEKKYLAAVCGETAEDGELNNWILKNERLNISKCVPPRTAKAKEARLAFRRLSKAETEEGILSLLEVELFTGRHHQIRVQLAENGTPIWGDTKYNGVFKRRRGFYFVALRAAYLSFAHPMTGKALRFEAPKSVQYPFTLFNYLS